MGVTSPSGVFGTTIGLLEKFGPERVLEVPASESAITGIALGAAISGMRPILIHQRVDFSLLSMDAIVNQAAKWHYMYGGAMSAPLTIRMIIGRGWGQGPQHSQSLQSWFAHIPGLRVLMPTTPTDAKGLLIAAVNGNTPTIILEHRWLFGIKGIVSKSFFEVSIGKAEVVKEGKDITIVSVSYMTIETLEAAKILENLQVSVEVIDLKTISPIDIDTIMKSVQKTRRVLIIDNGHISFGISAEILSLIIENSNFQLLSTPKRIGLPHAPTPTAYSLSEIYYPNTNDIIREVLEILKLKNIQIPELKITKFSDVPNENFTGPY
jgi:pyruvate dehydrogenase E1 component beta subunit